MTDKIKKAMQFKMNVMDGFISAMEREMRLAEEEFARLRPEDFKDKELLGEYVELMGEVQKSKEMLDFYKEAKDRLNEVKKEVETKSDKPGFGFVQLKEAA